MRSIKTMSGRLGTIVCGITRKGRQQSKRDRLHQAVCDSLESRRLFAAYFVTNTNDSGTGSLRQAIINANNYGAPVGISFDIPTSDPHYSGGVFTISPASALPAITGNSITLDASTQESYTGSTNGGRPVVYLNGGNQAFNGMIVSGANDGVSYLGIANFSGNTSVSVQGGGIITTGTLDSVQYCWVGIGPSGTSSMPNTDGLVAAAGSSGYFNQSDVVGYNQIGVAFLGSTNAQLYDGYIGVTPTGTSVPNGNGVLVESLFGIHGIVSATGNYIAVSSIDFNTRNGIELEGAGCTNNVMDSDMIGVTYTSTIGIAGYYAAGNGGDGVLITQGASNNTITNYGGFPAANATLIAGNTGNGVELDDASNNTIVGATIGEASHVSGHTIVYVRNGGAGVDIHNGSSGNLVGSSTTNNLISGNSAQGILFGSDAGTGNTVQDNYIGTDSSGDSLGNLNEGILVFSSGEIIEGDDIGGNGYSGMSIPGNSNIVTGCYIGTNPAGNAALPNSHEGIYINGNSNNVSGNTISGNAYTGISIVGSYSNTISGNYIGVSASGNAAVANTLQGVLITGTSNTLSGNTISGNGSYGIAVEADDNQVYGNDVGTDSTGSSSIPNAAGGIYVDSPSNTIGGTSPAFRNIISGNTAAFGVELDTSSAMTNTVEGNYIGINAAGTSALGNTIGVEISNSASNNSIGSLISGGGNVISGNSNDGIFITSSGSSTLVIGNYIGTNPGGSAAIGNGFDGVEIAAANNDIGGTSAASRNIISGNSNRDGVVIEGSGSTGDVVEENYIGTDASGSIAIPNSSGVEVISGASGASILSNLISGNSNRGIGLFGSSSTSSKVLSNDIGTDYTGTQPVPNVGIGILVNGDESVIGGDLVGQGNTIGFNEGGGISVSNSNDATVIDSTIYNNSNSGINNAGTLYTYNCTITGNTAASGAGIYTTGTLQCIDDTISLNTASSTGGGIDVASGTTLLLDTIIAQNAGGDVTGNIYSSSYFNLIGNGTGLTGITNSTPGDQIGTNSSPINALLGPLAFNGGTTETMAPKAGSPAYNAGSGGTTLDQRGVSRPSNGANDIGAVQRAFSSVAISGSAIYLRLANDGQTLDVYYNNTGTGTPASTYLLSDLASLSATGTSGNDQITIDTSNGIPLPAGSGFSYNGLAGTNTFEVIGSLGSETIGVNAANVTIASYTAGYSNVQNLIVNPLFGNTSLSVAAGLTVSLPAAPLGGGIFRLELPSLTLATNSKLILPAEPVHSDRISLLVPTLSVASGAALDMGNNDAFGFGGTLQTLNGLVQTGFNAGGTPWTGPGIDSSAAAADTHRLTALAVVQNNQSGTSLFTLSNPFDGLPLAPQVLVLKYTYYGDANLDGVVDGSDYSRIDTAYLSHGTLTGWINGDFNYDNVINGSDYTLIDNAYNSQGASLAASIAPARTTTYALPLIANSNDPAIDRKKIKPLRDEVLD